jgi:hypothetical protein
MNEIKPMGYVSAKVVAMLETYNGSYGALRTPVQIYSDDQIENTVPVYSADAVAGARAIAWQPGETAPKDGRTVLLFLEWGTERIVTAGFWDDNSAVFDPAWSIAEGSAFEIIAWAPLPQPPKEDGDE